MAGGNGGPVDYNDPQQWAHPGLNANAGFSLLHTRVKSGNINQVDAVIEAGGVNLLLKTTHEARTPLHLAVFRMHVPIVRSLLGTGVDDPILYENVTQSLCVKDRYGQTPLSLAGEKGHPVIVQMLLDRGASLTSTCLKGETPKQTAIRMENGPAVAVFNAEEERRERAIAIAMGHHPRLGEGSLVQQLDPGVLQIVGMFL